ncbi:YdgA family protein [Chromobacterium alticapitis]|uniref:YdgA family protein n=1 Tax=Chromobacterium alticapitis TaxID=2073169 RepID=UPI001E392888|nr:YdgA family protein [Chromobacterium alticapitis]
MLPKRKLTIAGAAIGGLFVLYAGSSYWAGVKAEDTLQEQYRMLSGLPLFKVKSHSYERGWFSSTETTELVFNRHLSGPYENMLPDNMKPLLNSTIKFTNHVQHGPLPGLSSFDLRPGRALVKTEFAMSDATRKTLKTFFGDKEPITIVNHIGLRGGGLLDVNVPAFDYEEALSGVKMKWKGFDLKVDYSHNYQEYKTEALSPGFLLEASSKGAVSFDGVHYASDTRLGATGVKLGTSELTIGGVQLTSRESMPYSIKLNELIYLMTRVRVGEFVNPSGEFKPSSVALKNFSYQIVTSEQDDFVNTRGKVNFAELSFNDRRYGPMRLDVSANHLHGPTLVKLDKAIGAIPFEGVDPAVLRKQYIDTIKKNAVPLLENNPKLLINEFYLKMPTGEAKLQGSLGINGLQSADLNDITLLAKRIEAEAKLSLPRQTLEDLVLAQARNLFTVDHTAEDQPNMQEVDDLAKSLLDSQLAQWKNDGYLLEDNGQISTELKYDAHGLTIHQKKVPLPWQEEAEPAGDASAPAAEPVKPAAKK